jgi:hypothetical protein
MLFYAFPKELGCTVEDGSAGAGAVVSGVVGQHAPHLGVTRDAAEIIVKCL